MTGAGMGSASFVFLDPCSPELPAAGTTRRLRQAGVVPCGLLLLAMS